MKGEKVYIIVLNYKNYKDTLMCLESLLELKYNDFSIIVIDNASNDGSSEKIMQWIQNYSNNISIEFIESKFNLGYAGGNNIGIRKALQDEEMKYVWVLNNDTIVNKEALAELVMKMNSDIRIGICGSKLIYNWDRNQIQGYGGWYNKFFGMGGTVKDEKKISEIDYVIGASMFFRRKVFETTGLFSEDYFLYFEELDFSQRIKGKFKMACAINSIVFHKEGASIGSNGRKPQEKSMLSDYYLIRNRILFTKKYCPLYLPTVYIGLIYAIFNRLRRKQFNRVPMIIKLMLGIKDNKFERY